MRPELLFCVSQQPNEIPFQFKATGLHVYSFEEALYHVYHHWKQSVDDFLSGELIAWVNDALGLSFLAARMKELTKVESFGARLLSFLRLIEYFSVAELEQLRLALTQWEKRLEWEKLKERADYLVGRGDPDKALILYRRALQYGENTALLNNIGVAYMQMEAYEEAFKLLGRARVLEPNNTALTLHYAEAAIYAGQYDEAAEALTKAALLTPAHPDVPFLQGVMCCEQGDYAQGITYFEKAIAINGTPEPHYLCKLADVYAGMRQYDRALAVLEMAADKDVDFFVKQAELYVSANNIPAAVKSMQKALMLRNNDAGLWVRLAMYHRLDYDLPAANGAIMKALAIDPENERAALENARIKKGMGRTKEYQAVLNGVLRDFKHKYREYC